MKALKWAALFWVQAFVLSLGLAFWDMFLHGEVRSTFMEGAVLVLAWRLFLRDMEASDERP